MTDTETIAVELFGWRRAESQEGFKAYRLGPSPTYLINQDGTARFRWVDCEWPDLADWNWIRKMENALAERGIVPWLAYGAALKSAVMADRKPTQIIFDSDVYLRATTAQRVAACLKVIEECQP